MANTLRIRPLRVILVKSGLITEGEQDGFTDVQIQKLIAQNFEIFYENNHSQAGQILILKKEIERLKTKNKAFVRG